MTNLFKDKIKKARDGVAKVIPAASPITIDGKQWKQPEILAALDTLDGLLVATEVARQQLQGALEAQKQALPSGHQLYIELGRALRTLLGKRNPELAEFGYAPTKARKVMSSEENLLAAEKRKLTRKARHTMGSKQKLAIQPAGKPTVVVLGPDGKPLGSGGSDPSAK